MTPLTDVRLEAFRLVGGPCDGEVAELPVEGFTETWRHVQGDEAPELYAEYERDGAVFRYAGRTITGYELAATIKEHEANAMIHMDSREYER